MEWKISDNDLILLDGVGSVEAQKLVDELKNRLSLEQDGLTPLQAEFIQKLASAAEKDGKLIQSRGHASSCGVCQTRPGYYPYPRNGRHHRKGDPNYTRPKLLYGYEFQASFIRIKDRWTLGCCMKCYATLLPHIKNHLSQLLARVKAEIPHELLNDGAPLYRRWDIRKCKQCGWQGPESQMGREPTLMGDGTFPSKCPKCSARNGLFSNQLDVVSGQYHFTPRTK